ncbi:MAG TPA: glycosyltransferase family 39 protein, partial [Dehalococcoidia bacterium]|nr:glycosyltransferase family 39 protein [Dehalococcoidia bacterium]
ASFVIFGTGLLTAKLVNVLAGVVTVYLVYRIGELSLGRTVGLIGALILALYPNHVIWSSTLYSDIYFTMWFSAAIYLLLRTNRWRGIQALVGAGAAGAVAGVAALTRGQGVVLLLLAAVFWLVLCGRRDMLMRGAAAGLTAAAVIGPWTVRNIFTFDAPIVIAANDGYNLRIGHSSYATGRYITPRDLWEAEPGITLKEREVLFSRLGRERAVDYALSHPREELVLALKKLYYVTIPDSDSIAWANFGASPIAPSWVLDSLKRLADIYYWLLLLFAALALVRLRSVTLVRLMGATVVLWAVFHVAFFGEPRFHLPLLPLLALLAAAGLREIWRAWSART